MITFADGAEPVAQAASGGIDPFWATVVTVVGGIIAAIIVYIQTRKSPNEVSVVKALLDRITALETQADERDSHDEERDREMKSMRAELAAARTELAAMWAKAQDQADQILFLKMWGSTVEGPPPRTPPPWRRDQ